MSAEHPRVWVVDNSPIIRETIGIVLGDDYEVHALPVDEYLRTPSRVDEADLLILSDDITAESLPELSSATPVLWLQGRDQPPPVSVAIFGTLPRSFDPEDLRTQVQRLLSERPPPQPPLSGRTLIDYPVLPRDAAMLARRAANTHFPVLICGEPGTGKARLARAIHAFGREGRFVAFTATNCSATALHHAAAITPGTLTVFVDDIADLPSNEQQLLLELLDCGGFTSAIGWHRVRLICASAQSSSDLARRGTLDKELFYRLSVFPITLPPLRERTHDIPVLAARITADLARALRTKAPTLTPRAIERLSHYLWFGNLAEFETVLTRTVALTQHGLIDATDLLFGYGRSAPRVRADRSIATVPSTPEPASNDAVDLVINELAHEFKNPMVTIKTVAQHLERLLADESGREQIARLTGEAVDRMDRTLENLLQFTRFTTPTPQDISLATLLAPCLTDLAPTLSERRVTLDYRPPELVAVFVDTEQIAYAFDNLLRAMARDLPEGETLVIHPLANNAAIAFEYRGAGRTLARKLTDFSHRHNGDTAPLPLGLVFARTLIERNGGRLDIHTASDRAAVNVWLPSRQEALPENGTTTNPHS